MSKIGKLKSLNSKSHLTGCSLRQNQEQLEMKLKFGGFLTHLSKCREFNVGVVLFVIGDTGL